MDLLTGQWGQMTTKCHHYERRHSCRRNLNFFGGTASIANNLCCQRIDQTVILSMERYALVLMLRHPNVNCYGDYVFLGVNHTSPLVDSIPLFDWHRNICQPTATRHLWCAGTSSRRDFCGSRWSCFVAATKWFYRYDRPIWTVYTWLDVE